MLSNIDIEKEIGKSICIHPLKLDNIKGNSINLTASEYAWSMGETKNFNEEELKALNLKGNLKIEELKRCNRISKNGKSKIVILPNSTTLIQTEEVLATSNNIGGSVHSKVGVVIRGLGHIGTMIGPNYYGHLLIAIHNITNKTILLDADKTFVSLTFNYLETPTTKINKNKSGHLEKYSNLGIKTTDDENQFIVDEWKISWSGILDKMKLSKEYKFLQDKLIDSFESEQQKLKKIKSNFHKKISTWLPLILIILTLFSPILIWFYYYETWSESLRNLIMTSFSGWLISLIYIPSKAYKFLYKRYIQNI